MIIKNFKELATEKQKKLALSILESGLRVAISIEPLKKIVKRDHIVINKQRISLRNYHKIYVIAVGKASDLMTKAVASHVRIDGGIVIIPQKTRSLLRSGKFAILRGSHPIPTTKSVEAAHKTLNFLANLTEADFVIFLISGGASSLVALPDGISLREKQTVTDLLLRSGANIHEINCVRKHLSKIKGGRLTESLKCQSIALVMSDVVDDDLSTIASGMTYYDKSTFCDAKRILIKYGLKNKISKNVLERIDLGIKGLIHETPKKARIKNYVISSNKNCLEAMATNARKLGLVPKIVAISGDVRDASSKLSKLIPKKPRSCIVFGGETTVKVKGRGMGGRNQELVLRLLDRLVKNKVRLIVASLGTDGIDGNTPVAGAIAATDIPMKEIKKYLDNNDSFSYFKKYSGVILTGPTHTNLMDVGLMLNG
jgi:hydroxypyruvate reductase